MRTSVYILRLIPECAGDRTTQATVYRHKRNALAVYESFAKSLFSGSLAADEVQLLKYTFMGTPQTVTAKALEIGSVLSRGKYITSDPFCDGDWEVDLIVTTGQEVGAT